MKPTQGGARKAMKPHPIDEIRKALQSLNIHIKNHGLPAAVKLQESWIEDCEKPFPLPEGNIADEEIELFRIAHEMDGRLVDINRDKLNQSVTITILDQGNKL